MKKFSVAILLGFGCLMNACGAGLDNMPFRMVLVDGASEAKHGAIPWDRKVLADGLKAINLCRPKAVVLGFFFVLTNSPSGDLELRKRIGEVPTILKAQMIPNSGSSNVLPERFFHPENGNRDKDGICDQGNEGMIPLAMLSEVAANVGFVGQPDLRRVPMLMRYEGKTVKSLWLCCLELAVKDPIRIDPGVRLTIGKTSHRLDPCSKMDIPESEANEGWISFDSVSKHKDEIEGKIVFVGYDGPKIPTVKTKWGKVGSHRLFYHQLCLVYKAVTDSSESIQK